MRNTFIFKSLLLIATCFFFLSCSSSSSTKLVKFEYGDAITFKTSDDLYAVPIDISTESIQTTFDVSAKTNSNSAHLSAKVKEAGYPYLLCNCSIHDVKVNGVDTPFAQATDPDKKNNFLLIKHASALDEELDIDIDYSMNSDQYTFQSGGIGFLVSTDDLMEGNYFEPYGPTNYEYDEYQLDWQLKVIGSSTQHQLFTNGSFTYVEDASSQTWSVHFPDYFTTSSFFLHLTNRTDLSVRKFNIQLKEKLLPVTVYGVSSSAVSQAVSALPGIFSELENDYGPYSHDSYVAYMTTSGGGMEYVGGAITSFWALDHEVTHSWFARGVMPADGRSGWIDEAIASWRDYGYKRASSYGKRSSTNLANFSPFERFTPDNCYVDGRALLAELDFVFASDGGFKKVLRDWHTKYDHQTITTQQFIDFIEARTSVDLRPLFTKNIYGNFMVPMSASGQSISPLAVDDKHPRPLTHAEVVELR